MLLSRIFRRNTFLLKAICASLVLFLFPYGVVFPQVNQNVLINTGHNLLMPSGNYSFPTLKGIRFNPNNPLKLEFIIDAADQGHVDKNEAEKLTKYFLAGLTLSENELWVNLSPYEQNRIIPEALGGTDLGKDMLEQDYLLKQLAASLTYPETQLGKKYWKIVNANKGGGNNLSKVWVMPDQVAVYENSNAAFIVESTLKVMMEDDYLALQKNNIAANGHSLAAQAFKQNILPAITQEVNTGKHFANLRQIYRSLILAVWFKQKFKQSFYKNYINAHKIKGIDLADKNVKDKIWQEYVSAFKEGVYNYTRTETISSVKRIKRKYFSGGCDFGGVAKQMRRSLPAPVISMGIFALLGAVVAINGLEGGFSDTSQATASSKLPVEREAGYADYKLAYDLNRKLTTFLREYDNYRGGSKELIDTIAPLAKAGLITHADLPKEFFSSLEYAFDHLVLLKSYLVPLVEAGVLTRQDIPVATLSKIREGLTSSSEKVKDEAEEGLWALCRAGVATNEDIPDAYVEQINRDLHSEDVLVYGQAFRSAARLVAVPGMEKRNVDWQGVKSLVWDLGSVYIDELVMLVKSGIIKREEISSKIIGNFIYESMEKGDSSADDNQYRFCRDLMAAGLMNKYNVPRPVVLKVTADFNSGLEYDLKKPHTVSTAGGIKYLAQSGLVKRADLSSETIERIFKGIFSDDKDVKTNSLLIIAELAEGGLLTAVDVPVGFLSMVTGYFNERPYYGIDWYAPHIDRSDVALDKAIARVIQGLSSLDPEFKRMQALLDLPGAGSRSMALLRLAAIHDRLSRGDTYFQKAVVLQNLAHRGMNIASMPGYDPDSLYRLFIACPPDKAGEIFDTIARATAKAVNFFEVITQALQIIIPQLSSEEFYRAGLAIYDIATDHPQILDHLSEVDRMILLYTNHLIAGKVSLGEIRDIYRIYDNDRDVKQALSGVGPMAKWSIARSVDDTFKSYGQPYDSQKAAQLIVWLVGVRAQHGNAVVMENGGSLYIANHGDRRFTTGDVKPIFQPFMGGGSVYSYKGMGSKAAIETAMTIPVNPRGTVWYLNAHGGPDHVWLDDGALGDEKSDDLHHPKALSFLEMGTAWKKGIDKSRDNSAYFTGFIDACFSTDSMIRTVNVMGSLGGGRIVAANQFGLTSFSITFAMQMKMAADAQVHNDGKLFFSAMYNANENMHDQYLHEFKASLPWSAVSGQHFTFFLGLTTFQQAERDRIMGAPVPQGQPKGMAVLNPSVPVTEAIGNKAQGVVRDGKDGQLLLDIAADGSPVGTVALAPRMEQEKDIENVKGLLAVSARLQEQPVLQKFLSSLVAGKDAPRHYVYGTTGIDGKEVDIKDLFGVSPKDTATHDLVALYQGLLDITDEPTQALAWFHEIAHNAINKGKLDFDLSESMGEAHLVVYDGKRDRGAKIVAEILLTSDAALKFARRALNGPEKYRDHDLLRAFQFEVFGIVDAALSNVIDALQKKGSTQEANVSESEKNGGLDFNYKSFNIKTSGEIIAPSASNDGKKNYDYLAIGATDLKAITAQEAQDFITTAP